MSQLESVKKVQKEVSRLITVLEALEGFSGSYKDRAAFERQASAAGESVLAAVSAAGLVAKKAKRAIRKSSAEVIAWRSAHMKVLVTVQKAKKGSAEHAAAKAAYAAWRASNPAPVSKK